MTGSTRAAELRDGMTDTLIADGRIASPAVEAAFRAVPRHQFVPPGTSLDDAYGAYVAPITKVDVNGAHLSSVSAPWLQATMITQAGIEPGMRVLEIGSGGYNAALMAEITGQGGLVITMDIDPDITARATAALRAARYRERVTVITADGEHGVADYAPYDAIVVTAGAWDVPPAWIAQLAEKHGTLVLPLRMNTITRSIAFRRAAGHLVSISAEMCGFVPIQGAGARAERTFRLRGPAGGYVELRFDHEASSDLRLLDGALAAGPMMAWSGVRIASAVSFADLHLWLAAFLPGFCRVAASDGTALGAAKVGQDWFPYGGVHGDSFCYQASRRVDQPGDPEFEFGAGAYGLHAQDAAGAFVERIQEWDARGRDLPGDAFAFWPAGTVPPAQPDGTAIFPKNHGTVTISWPTRPGRNPRTKG